MKKLIVTLMLSALCACSSPYLTDTSITSAVAVATGTTLKYVIKDAAKRTTIANYIDVSAAALRTITGAPTPQQLAALLDSAIPADVKANYPEIVAFVSPIILSTYQSAFDKYGADAAKLYKVLNDIAIGLETGAAPYVTPKT